MDRPALPSKRIRFVWDFTFVRIELGCRRDIVAVTFKAREKRLPLAGISRFA